MRREQKKVNTQTKQKKKKHTHSMIILNETLWNGCTVRQTHNREKLKEKLQLNKRQNKQSNEEANRQPKRKSQFFYRLPTNVVWTDKCIWNSKFYSLSRAHSSQSELLGFFFSFFLPSFFSVVVSIKNDNGHATNTWNEWEQWSVANLSWSSHQHIRFNLDTLQDSRGCASFFFLMS